MLRPTVHDVGARLRAARLLATILLLGGLVGGPLAHLALEATVSPTAVGHHGHGDHHAPAPDAHHDCPVCITFSGALAPVLSPAPVAALGDEDRWVSVGPTFHDRLSAERARARAPPTA